MKGVIANCLNMCICMTVAVLFGNISASETFKLLFFVFFSSVSTFVWQLYFDEIN